MTSRISRVAAALVGAGVIGASLTGFASASAAEASDEFPALMLRAQPNVAPGVTAGQQAGFDFEVTNVGNVPLTLKGIVAQVEYPASQSNLSHVSCPTSVLKPLKPGAEVTCTGAYTLTVADVLRGSVVVNARATAVSDESYIETQNQARLEVDNKTLPPVERGGSKYAIVNKNSGKVLDVNSQGEIVQTDPTDAERQAWTFTNDIGSTPKPSIAPVNIHNVATGQLLGIIGGWTGNGATAVQWPDANVADQSWDFVPTADGAYTIVNNNSGKVLGIPAGSRQEGEKAVQWTSEGVADQKWTLVKIG